METLPLTALLALGKYRGLDDPLTVGTLEARQGAKGVVFFWRLDIGPKTYRYKIGPWDSSAPPLKASPGPRGYSRAAAHEAARAMAKIHTSEEWSGKGGYPAKVAHDEAEQAAIETHAQAKRIAHAAEEKALAEAAKDKKQHSLEKLVEAYAKFLSAKGKQSAYDARNLLTNHILKQHPKLAAMPAADIEPEQFADAIRAINEAGKGRTANKVRSYLRAAYALAAKAKTDPSIPLAFKAFKVRHNPVMDVAVITGANRRDKNPIKGDAFIAYWKAIEQLPGIPGHVLKLHLLSGGQRIAQFVRLRKADVDADSFTLRDPKGKRSEARLHQVPLTAAAKVEMKALLALSTEPAGFVISADAGESGMWPSTVNAWAKDAAKGIEGFTIKRIRSGVETLLSSRGIPQEVRAQLQSHGLGGVQQQSYDGHDYMPEKRHALETLFSALTQPETAKVVTLRKARATAKP